MAYELQNKCDIVSSNSQILSKRINKIGSTIAELSKAFRKFAVFNYGRWEEDYLNQLMNCNNISNYLENKIILLEGDKNGTIY